MISSTIHVHYNPEAEDERPTGSVVVSLSEPFGSLRFGSNMSVLISDPATLHLIADAARTLAAQLREAQVTS